MELLWLNKRFKYLGGKSTENDKTSRIMILVFVDLYFNCLVIVPLILDFVDNDHGIFHLTDPNPPCKHGRYSREEKIQEKQQTYWSPPNRNIRAGKVFSNEIIWDKGSC